MTHVASSVEKSTSRDCVYVVAYSATLISKPSIIQTLDYPNPRLSKHLIILYHKINDVHSYYDVLKEG